MLFSDGWKENEPNGRGCGLHFQGRSSNIIADENAKRNSLKTHKRWQ